MDIEWRCGHEKNEKKKKKSIYKSCYCGLYHAVSDQYVSFDLAGKVKI